MNEEEIVQELMEMYGENLTNIFDELFEQQVAQGQYMCVPETWKLVYLQSYDFRNEEESDDDQILKQPRFSHSFRYSRNHPDEQEVLTAEAYLVSFQLVFEIMCGSNCINNNF